MENRFITLTMGMELIPGQEPEETGISEIRSTGGMDLTASRERKMIRRSISAVLIRMESPSITLTMGTELIPGPARMKHGVRMMMRSGAMDRTIYRGQVTITKRILLQGPRIQSPRSQRNRSPRSRDLLIRPPRKSQKKAVKRARR